MGSHTVWQREFESPTKDGVPTTAGLMLTSSDGLRVVDSDDGTTRWMQSSDDLIVTSMVEDETIYTLDLSVPGVAPDDLLDVDIREVEGILTLRGVDTESGTLQFEAEIGESEIPLSPPPAVADGTCFVHVFDRSQLVAVRPGEDTSRWTIEMEDEPAVTFGNMNNIQRPIVVGDTVVVTTTERNVRAYDCETGEPRFTFEGGPTTDPLFVAVVEGESPVVAVGAADGAYGYHAESGERLWSFPESGRPDTIVSAVGTEFVVGTSDGEYAVLDPVSGDRTGTIRGIDEPPRDHWASDGTFFVTTSTDVGSNVDRRLHAIDVDRRSRRWTLDFDDPITDFAVGTDLACVVSGPISGDGSDTVVGVDPDDGNVAWEREPDGEPSWCHVDSETAFVGTHSGTVSAIRSEGLVEGVLDRFRG